MADLGRLLMITGGGLLLLGLILMLAGRIPGLGQLPGDISIERGNFRVYAPLGTMVVLSVILTIVINIVARMMR
ncbi:MAG: DUF2905 domain-containing protein [Caldilineaceae bacterium]|nr:DUF2905 domain-containing protein [Caldilineaceae bacterium]